MREFRLFTLIFPAALFFSDALLAADAWTPEFFSSDPKSVLEAADKVANPDGVDLYVLELKYLARIDTDGRVFRTNRFVLRVVTDGGAKQIANYSQAYLAWRQDKPELRARVITPDGQPHILETATITDAGIPNLVQGLFTDTKLLAAPLPAVAKGAVVEIEVILNDREPFSGGAADTFAISLPTRHSLATIDCPAGSSIHIATPGIPGVTRKESREGNREKILLEAADIKIRDFSLENPDQYPAPQLVFSTVQDWQHAAQWYWNTSEPQIGVKQPPAADAKSRIAEIESILAELQRSVRYTGIEFGLSAYVPHTPAQTIARGYGDCKDKAALLISRLRAAGIAANLALLNPYPSNNVAADVPGVPLFSHAIVYVPGAGLFIDPTSEYTHAGKLASVDQNRSTLIVDPATTALTRTPATKAEENGTAQVFTLKLSEEGKADYTLQISPFGASEEYMRAFGAQWFALPETRRADALKQTAQTAGVEKVLANEWGDPKDINATYRTTVRGEGYKNSGGSERFVYAYVPQTLQQPSQFAQLLAEIGREENTNKKRTADYDFALGTTAIEQWRLVPPPGFKVRKLPEVKDRTIGPLTIARKVSQEKDGTVVFDYRLELKSHVTLADAKQIRYSIKQTPLGGTTLVEFIPEGVLLMSDGKWKEGIDLLRRDAEAKPIRTGPALRYSQALLEAGLRDEALKICKSAIDADPKSARAWAYLSVVERYDAIGRPDRPGKNLAAVDQAIQNAAGLDPTNKRYIVDRALVKELSDNERYEDQKRLSEGIGLLESIVADLPEIQQQNVLADALLHAHRFADLKAYCDKPEGRNVRDDYKFAAIAGAEGSAAAISESRALPESTRKSTLQASARDLTFVGEYAKAGELLDSLSDPSQNSSVEMLRHAGKHGETPISKDPVIAVVERYILALLDHLARPTYDQLLTPEWRVLTRPAQRNEMISLFGAYRNVAGMNVGTRATADLAIGNAEFVKEGSDAVGYRVRFADPTANGAMKTIAWVVRREGEYKILGLRTDASLGSEALSLAKKGNLEGARKWLDWGREETTPSTSPDPFGTPLFSRLWPAGVESPSKDQIMIGAAGLVTSGYYRAEGIELLQALRDKAAGEALRAAVDQALVNGLSAESKYDEAIPIALGLVQAHPSSPFLINLAGTAMINGGRPQDALKMIAAAKPIDDAGIAAVARVKARAHQYRHEFAEAAEAYRTLCNANKGTAVDWNNLAWLTLFAPGKLVPDTKAAETAVRLTQERTIGHIHTLAAIQAEAGRLKEARAGLVRYVGTNEIINDSAWYLQGRIAEALGLKDAATAIYSNITKPARPTGDAAYDLAQIRLAVMNTKSN